MCSSLTSAFGAAKPRPPFYRCDAAQHSGPTLNPLPHRREELSTGNALGAKEGAANGPHVAGGVIDGVFLRCTAVCLICGLRDWAPHGAHDVGGLTIIGPAGRVLCDRVAYKCQTPSCTAVLSSNDPHQYLTANTIPVTLGNVRTVMTAELGHLLLSMRTFTPGLSPTAMALALSTNSKQPPVNRKHVADVVSALADMQAVTDRSCGKQGPPGKDRLVACDMNAKVWPPTCSVSLARFPSCRMGFHECVEFTDPACPSAWPLHTAWVSHTQFPPPCARPTRHRVSHTQFLPNPCHTGSLTPGFYHTTTTTGLTHPVSTTLRPTHPAPGLSHTHAQPLLGLRGLVHCC